MQAGPLCGIDESGVLTLYAAGHDPASLKVFRGTVERVGPINLEVRVHVSESPLTVSAGSARFDLRLVRHAADPTVVQAERSMRAGQLSRAWTTLEPVLRSARGPTAAQAHAVAARVRMRAGALDEAERLFQRAIQLDRKTGRVSAEFRNRFALSYLRGFQRRDFAAVEGILRPLKELAGQYPEGEAIEPYYRGLVALETGAVAEALRLYRDVRGRAARLGLHGRSVDARFVEVRLLRRLGRLEEAAALLDGFDPDLLPREPPCLRAERLYNAAWYTYEIRRAQRRPASSDVHQAIKRAAETFRGECAHDRLRATTAIGWATALIDRDRWAAAAAWLDEARQHVGDDRGLRLHLLRQEARWHESQSDPAVAEKRWALVRRWARRIDHVAGLRWAAEAEARLAVRSNRRRAAAAAYERAATLLEAQLARIPLGEGRESFLEVHDTLGRRQVELLIEDRRFADAFDAARASASRPLRALSWASRVEALSPPDRRAWYLRLARYRSARAAAAEWARTQPAPWRLSRSDRRSHQARADELSAEVLRRLEDALSVLGQTPSPRLPQLMFPPAAFGLWLVPMVSGWAAFLADADGLRVETTTSSAPRWAASTLVRAHGPALSRASRLIVVAAGPMSRVDLHALPIHGRPLGHRLPVIYGLDVAPRSAPGDHGGALVVAADPGQSLAFLSHDAHHAAAQLERSHPPVTLLSGSEARHSSVLNALRSDTPAVFHFSGHAAARGTDGWQAGLLLSDGQWLTAADVLTLSRVPEVAVLAGCETSGASRSGPVYGLGLAEAFVLSGAKTVLSTSRPVDDHQASALVRALYRSGWNGDVAHTLHRVQRDLAKVDPQMDWAAFRVVEAVPEATGSPRTTSLRTPPRKRGSRPKKTF